jgi:glycolate oxidase FAD binding subunit
MLAQANQAGQPVVVRGAATKLDWGGTAASDAVELSTTGLARLSEHNAGDLTAIAEPGLPLAAAQGTFSEAGQMLALDPPLGSESAATLGGIVASGDSGPLRHRYGSARDLVIGITVALADGTIAKSGGRVIKNVAGYDLAKLFAGSFGTLGAIVELCVRLHPLPPERVTALAVSDDTDAIAAAASVLAHAPLELESLDVGLVADGRAAVLARLAGAAPARAAEPALALIREAGLSPELAEEDDALWAFQRDSQRSAHGTVVRVSATQTQLGHVLECARRAGARVVGRAALGLSWVAFEERSAAEQADAVAELRAALAPSPCAVLDAPAEVRELLEPWPAPEPGALELMRRVKERFDPSQTLAPGSFVGGI